MNGFIKVHRSMLDWEWYDDWPCFRLFMHLLLTVNWKPTRYMGYDIPAGAKPCGYHALAEQTGLSVMQVRTAINKLKETGEVTIKKTNKFSIISITNWHKYQEEEQADNKRITSEQQADNKRVTTDKEGKNGKKGNNTRAHSSDANLKPEDVSQETWNDFLQIRQAKKKPLTQSAVKMLCTEAQKAGWSTESAVQEAAARGWQSFKASYVADQQTQQPAKRKNPQPSEWGLL